MSPGHSSVRRFWKKFCCLPALELICKNLTGPEAMDASGGLHDGRAAIRTNLMEVFMTPAGWIFMAISWGIILSLGIFCFNRTLRRKK